MCITVHPHRLKHISAIEKQIIPPLLILELSSQEKPKNPITSRILILNINNMELHMARF